MQKTTARNASIQELLDGIQPYLNDDDDRISQEHRQRLRRLSKLTRRMIKASESTPASQVRTLLATAAEEPGLLRSNHFWRYLRRSGRRVFLPRSAA
jgi:hypothetical protein